MSGTALPIEPTRPLRVLLMISSLDGGGSERQISLLLKHLDRSRFAPELYLLHRRGSLLDQVPSDVPIHAFADSAATAADSRWGRSDWAERLPGTIHRRQVAHCRQLLRQRSIDVVYDRTFHMSLIASPAADALAIPRVATVVSPPSQAVPLHAGRFLAVKRRQLRTAYRRAAAVVAVSRHTADDAAAYHRLPRNLFQVIANPVDAIELDRQIAEAPFTPPRDGRFTIVCVGRLSPEKGQDELIAAMGCLCRGKPPADRPRLWIVGEGPCRQAWEQRVRDNGLSDDVVFWGQRADAAVWIAAADALCLPSHFEGFPNVVLEAMAVGTPVVARAIPALDGLSQLGPHPDAADSDYLWTFAGDDQRPGQQLAEKLTILRCNSAATRSKLNAARQLVRQSLTVSRVVGRLETLLERAAGAR